MNSPNESQGFQRETVVEEDAVWGPSCRPQLLVSVRDLEEYRLSSESGVDVIDLKEPRAGALAPTDAELWHQVAQEWSGGDRVPLAPLLSAALGEPDEALVVARLLPAEFHFAKAGPSGCRTQGQLTQLWSEIRARLDRNVELVGVAYADHEEAACLPPEEVLRAAAGFGLQRCLLDTFTKDGRSSVERLGPAKLRSFGGIARQLGLWWALAGSIREHEIGPLLAAEVVPNCFGVRGDVCQRSRKGTLLADRIEAWMSVLQDCGTDRSERS